MSMSANPTDKPFPPDGVFDAQTNTYTDGLGRKVGNVHSARQCEGRPCVIHAPSDHVMRGFPTHLRIPGPFDIKQMHMERICPHGVGHPDPDDAAYQRSLGPNMSVDVHGCDGCCGDPDQEVRDAILDELTKDEVRPWPMSDEPTIESLQAMIRSITDDLMEADEEIENLHEALAGLDQSYETLKLSRDFWRDCANRALERANDADQS